LDRIWSEAEYDIVVVFYNSLILTLRPYIAFTNLIQGSPFGQGLKTTNLKVKVQTPAISKAKLGISELQVPDNNNK
jgi:hypothetical protein